MQRPRITKAILKDREIRGLMLPYCKTSCKAVGGCGTGERIDRWVTGVESRNSLLIFFFNRMPKSLMEKGKFLNRWCCDICVIPALTLWKRQNWNSERIGLGGERDEWGSRGFLRQ